MRSEVTRLTISGLMVAAVVLGTMGPVGTTVAQAEGKQGFIGSGSAERTKAEEKEKSEGRSKGASNFDVASLGELLGSDLGGLGLGGSDLGDFGLGGLDLGGSGLGDFGLGGSDLGDFGLDGFDLGELGGSDLNDLLGGGSSSELTKLLEALKK